MKTNFLLAAATTIMMLLNTQWAHSQNWHRGGDNVGADAELGSIDKYDVIFISNNKERARFESGGTFKIGKGSNHAEFDKDSKLQFYGNGGYYIGSNRYVFQSDANEDRGLLQDDLNSRWSFTDDAGNDVVRISYTGDLHVDGQLKLGSVEALSDGGVSTIASNSALVPDFDIAHNLGSTTNRWNNAYASRAYLSYGSTLTLTNDGPLTLGSTSGTNLTMDGNEIQARQNGLASTLYVNQYGGDLDLGGSTVYFGSVESIADAGASLIQVDADFIPDVDGYWYLGNSTYRWNTVWATNGTINTSDARLKENVKDLNYGLADLMKLRPVSYTWIKSPEEGTRLGLIAQEAQQVIPEMVRDWDYTTDEKTGKRIKVPSKYLGIEYDELFPVLIKSIQQQQETLADQQGTIDEQSKKIDDLEQRMAQLESLVGSGSVSGSKSAASAVATQSTLFQNAPNPFNESTVIRYALPANASGIIQVTDANGRIIMAIPTDATGQHTIQGSELNAGTYLCSLIINGQTVDTKQMVLIR